MNREKIVVIDFGGQYNQLVARRVRENHVYCEIYSYKTDIQQIKAMNPKGIILTGGPNSCYEEGAASCGKELFEMGIPVLGLCYGAQLMQYVLGGNVCKAPVREYGKIEVTVDKTSKLFSDVSEKTICWMSHNDYIERIAPGFRIVAHTPDCPVAAAEWEEKNLYAIQFHPEVLHTQEGSKMLHNFVYNVCGCSGDWTMDAFAENSIKAIREKVGNGKVLCALSGDVIDDKNEQYDQVLVAIDELEDKFPGEMPDEVRGRLDELRNIVDELKLSDGEEGASIDDAMVIIEDLRSDYEVAGADSDEINDLFDEIVSKLQGDSDIEEIDVEDDDSDLDVETDVEVDEAEGDDLASDLEAEGEADINAGIEDELEAGDMESDSEAEDDTVEIKEETYDDLLDILNRLEAENGSDDAIEEGWSNIPDPRKKMTSEEEGVNKKGTMNFGKLPDMKLNKKPRLGVSSTDSKGQSADKKPKVDSIENKGTKQWHKVEKPANKPAAGKSMMGN